jgi:hypothetical protein
VARLQLITRLDSEPHWYRGGSTPQVQDLPYYTPIVSIFFVPPAATSWEPPRGADRVRQHHAVVDTGCPLTILPYDYWSPLAGETQLLDQAGLPTGVSGVAGVDAGYTLRRVRLALIGQNGEWMPPEWVTARCLEPIPVDPTREPIPPLLGLTTPFFIQGRRFRHDPDARQVIDEPNSVFAPQWWLEDPPAGLLARLAGAK